MPIILDSPYVPAKPAVIAHEIVSFAVNLQTMTASMEFIAIDESGGKAPAFGITCNLLDAEGNPRFTTPEYGSIKTALYRLALEDGHVAGTVA